MLPSETIFYIGDTARVPYGGKSRKTVERYSIEIGGLLLAEQAKMIVVACNTASALAVPRMKELFKVPVQGVVTPGAEASLRATRNGRIGVIGTRATIASGAYERAIHALDPRAKVFSEACPLLVPLIEEGMFDDPITDQIINRYLAPLFAEDIDTLVLGCTHYPLAQEAIARVGGKHYHPGRFRRELRPRGQGPSRRPGPRRAGGPSGKTRCRPDRLYGGLSPHGRAGPGAGYRRRAAPHGAGGIDASDKQLAAFSRWQSPRLSARYGQETFSSVNIQNMPAVLEENECGGSSARWRANFSGRCPRALQLPLQELGALADFRRQAAKDDAYDGRGGDIVTYIVDRNVNYTNVCNVYCKFCAFYRTEKDADHYVLSIEQIDQKLDELAAEGGVQVLLQGGHHPKLGIDFYLDMLSHIRAKYPQINIHGFSPPEFNHFSQVFRNATAGGDRRFQQAGLGSIPGGGGEILVDRVRDRIAPLKCKTDQWLEVMRIGHELGLRSSATMMFGHVESVDDRIEHLQRLRDTQDETGGFTAFICWTFQPENTRLKAETVTSAEYLRMQALSRIFLDNFENVQSSWVTQGPKIGQIALKFGANDFGSVMMEENVVSSAGTTFRLNAAGYRTPHSRRRLRTASPQHLVSAAQLAGTAFRLRLIHRWKLFIALTLFADR